MKKITIILAFIATAFTFASCNKYCVCTVSKDGTTLQENNYSDEKLTRDQCAAKVDSTWKELSSTYTSESLVGVSVQCDHL